MEHPVWKILKKEKYVEEFYPKAEEMYDFIQSLINITGNITENGETIPTMLKFFNMWNEYDSETFWILSELVHKNKIQWNDDLLGREVNNIKASKVNAINKIAIKGDRNEPVIAAIQNIEINHPELYKELSKVIDVELWDGYSLMIHEEIE